MLCERRGRRARAAPARRATGSRRGTIRIIARSFREAAAEEEEVEAEADGGKEKAKSFVIKIDQIRAVGDFMALSTLSRGLSRTGAASGRSASNRRVPTRC
jgi:hypothetical protein